MVSAFPLASSDALSIKSGLNVPTNHLRQSKQMLQAPINRIKVLRITQYKIGNLGDAHSS